METGDGGRQRTVPCLPPVSPSPGIHIKRTGQKQNILSGPYYFIRLWSNHPDLTVILPVRYLCRLTLGVQVIVHVADMGLEEFFKAQLAVVAAQAGLADARMEALEGLEVLAVDIGLAVVQLV